MDITRFAMKLFKLHVSYIGLKQKDWRQWCYNDHGDINTASWETLVPYLDQGWGGHSPQFLRDSLHGDVMLTIYNPEKLKLSLVRSSFCGQQPPNERRALRDAS